MSLHSSLSWVILCADDVYGGALDGYVSLFFALIVCKFLGLSKGMVFCAKIAKCIFLRSEALKSKFSESVKLKKNKRNRI